MPELTAAERLPHAGPALLVERAVDVTEDVIRCTARVPANSPFRTGDRAPAFLAIEMGAQAAALHDLVAQDAHCEPDRHGFIVAVRDTTFHELDLPADATFDVEARRDVSMPPLFNYSVRVNANGKLLVEASISTYAPPSED